MRLLAAPRGEWRATADEREVAEKVTSTPISKGEAARMLIRSPRLLPDAMRLALTAAYTGVWSDSGLRALLNSERVRREIPHLARGTAQWAPEEPFVSFLLSRLSPGDQVVDLGCGSGRIARHAADRVDHLLCIDVSRTMLSDARRHLGDQPQVDYRLATGCNLRELPDSSYDKVYAHAVFYFIDLVPALGLLDDIHRVLRPGGECIASFRTIDDEVSAQQALEDSRMARDRGIGSGRFRPYTLSHIEAMFSLAGLPVIDTQRSPAGDRTGYVVAVGKAT